MTRVLISAGSSVTLAGLESLIGANGDFQIVGRAQHESDARDAVEELHPDVVVVAMDDDAESALHQVNIISSQVRPPAVVLLGQKSDGAWVADALRAGARAVVPADASPEEMRAAITAAAAGLVTMHPHLAQTAQSAVFGVRTVDGVRTALTARERDVLQMMADGLGNKTIARRLGISMHTVKFHVGSIMSKLHASSRTEAVTMGIRQGLILL